MRTTTDTTTTARAIRRIGFRRWYERELLQGHAHLVLLVLCALALLGSFEAWGEPGSPASGHLLLAACAAASALIGAWSIRRYLYLLHHAEFVADQASCRSCRAYGRWDVAADDAGERRLTARCRRCGGEWPILL